MTSKANNKIKFSLEALTFLIAFTFPATILMGPMFGGVFWFSSFFLAFVLIPILDEFFPHEKFTPLKEEDKDRKNFFI